MSDNVNHPKHYQKEGRPECIQEMLEKFGAIAVYWFSVLSSYKYRYRAGDKDGNSAEQDEAKAVWYDNETEKMRALGAPSGWISCSDRKPDGESYKWAVGITSSGRCIAFQEHNAYENDNGGISVPTYLAHGSEITHWMPLADVPKEVSE